MSQGPLFSVVVPTFDRPRALARALAGLAHQDFPSFEVIVVDDGGSQPPHDIVTPPLRLLRQARSGPAAARNLGARHAAGRLVAFLDDDCVPRPDWLRRLAESHAAWPHHALAGQVVNGLPDDPYAAASQLLVEYLCGYYNRPGRALFATSNNLVFPAEGLRALGGFDTGFPRAGGEDRDLCERWVRAGHGMVSAEEARVDHYHEMTLAAFVRQHLGYGRGAYRFHRKRGGGVRPEPLRFYLDLLRYPARQGRPQLRSSALMLVTQVANAAGYLLAALAAEPEAVGTPAFERRP